MKLVLYSTTRWLIRQEKRYVSKSTINSCKKVLKRCTYRLLISHGHVLNITWTRINQLECHLPVPLKPGGIPTSQLQWTESSKDTCAVLGDTLQTRCEIGPKLCLVLCRDLPCGVCFVLLASVGFLWVLCLKTCSFGLAELETLHWRVWMWEWMIVSVCWPCRTLTTCPGCTPPLAQCQLGLALAPPVTLKE